MIHYASWFGRLELNLLLHLCRQRAANKVHADGPKRTRARDRAVRAFPAPDANAELQSNLDVCNSCTISCVICVPLIYFLFFFLHFDNPLFHHLAFDLLLLEFYLFN